MQTAEMNEMSISPTQDGLMRGEAERTLICETKIMPVDDLLYSQETCSGRCGPHPSTPQPTGYPGENEVRKLLGQAYRKGPRATQNMRVEGEAAHIERITEPQQTEGGSDPRRA